MKNMKVATKLFIGFLTVTILAATIGIVGIVGIQRMDAASEEMYAQKALPLGDLAQAIEYFQRLRVQARNCVIFTGDTAQLATIEKDINNRIQTFEAAMANYEPTISTQRGKDLFNTIMTNYVPFKAGVLELLEGAKKGTPIAELVVTMNSVATQTNVAADALNELTKARMEVMYSASVENKSLGTILLTVIIAVLVIAVAISVILAVYISGIISKPLKFVQGYIAEIARTGNLGLVDENKELADKYSQQKDEIGETVVAANSLFELMQFQGSILKRIADRDIDHYVKLRSDKCTIGLIATDLLDQLNDVMGDIQSSASQVSSGSKQIADGSQALAQGATEQAASVQQLSASITEVAGKTKQNAEMAEQAANLAKSIKHNAEKGSSQMDSMTQAVREINEASQSINKVIKVIDDIAFQTNILALNAAVEAARAGQHGKGFAVVADEVRNLASKSAEAAKDTGVLIANSMEKAELGAKIAAETAASLVEIVAGINESTEIVSGIAVSSKEQTVSIGQINEGITQVAQVVQQNSATSEESAAAAQQMSSQAEVLSNLASLFKIRGGSARTSASSCAVPQKHQASSFGSNHSTGMSLSGGKY